MPLSENPAGLSPMMRQYMEIKREHRDEILLYRLGDFYEMFFEDALTASKELDLVLTGRECGLSERAPMCGVPHHSSEGYIARLIQKGYKVAICEQVENPALAKGIVRREVIRIVTPGTVTESSMLDEGSNNYIAGLFVAAGGFGLSFADISTGSVEVTEAKLDIGVITSELARFTPREVVMNGEAYDNEEITRFVDKQLGAVRERLYDGFFQLETAKDSIHSQFGANDTAVLNGLKNRWGIKALGALIKYIRQTQHKGAERLVKLNAYKCAQYLSISAESRRNLELTESLRTREKRGSLLWAIDKTESSMGKRLLRSFLEKPLTDPGEIGSRLDAVSELFDKTVVTSKLRESLGKIVDIERLMTRVVYNSCSPRDLAALANASDELENIKHDGSGLTAALLAETIAKIDNLGDIAARIRTTLSDEPPALLREGGFIRNGFSQEVDELRELLHNNRNILTRMEQNLREKTGIKPLKIGYNKVFGYYIEVSRSNIENVPDYFIRKQTLTNGERYITEELKTLENKILGANERLSVLERDLFEELRSAVEADIKRIQRTADAAALLDVLCCFASLAAERSYTRPQVDGGDTVAIKNGRHPVVELINRNTELFVPNDALLDGKANLINIITGPNMSGKSTYMRQTALIILLAQMGCFVPAKEARIGVTDAIFTRIGASDDLFSGDSTFMVEMKEIAGIFKKASKKSLLILDEVGRGTSTYDGMSIARAVIEQIAAKDGLRAKTMFATHYHELTVMDREYDCVKNYNIAAKKVNDNIVFMRRIIHGPSDDSYGIEVAKLAGVPDEVIERAKVILKELELRQGMPSAHVSPKAAEVSGDGAELLEKLRGMSIEKLTPLEAMFTLNELVLAARNTEEI